MTLEPLREELLTCLAAAVKLYRKKTVVFYFFLSEECMVKDYLLIPPKEQISPDH